MRARARRTCRRTHRLRERSAPHDVVRHERRQPRPDDQGTEVGYVGRRRAAPSSRASSRTRSTGRAPSAASTRRPRRSPSTTRARRASRRWFIDYSNGLFALATSSTPLVSVTLDTGSKLMVIPPSTGGNMALGVNGLQANTLAARSASYVDVTMTGVAFTFNGGSGNDIFTATWRAGPRCRRPGTRWPRSPLPSAWRRR